uniref:Galaxin-like repeats domain-containing protein n=3 Tax=Ciona intestinalis TaxID=7719 RepID=H2Y0T4_CIOIN
MCKLIAIAVILIVGLSWTCYGGRIRKICNGHGRSRMHRNYTCCQNSGTGGWTPQPILPDHRCCPGSGRTFSESENQVCDNGRIREKTNPDETMCGVLLPYNVNSQVCCKTNITTARVYDKVPNGQCCNHDYLTDDSIRCCGGQTYDILNQTCCNSSETDTGVRLYNISNGKCCNDRPYDQTRQECNSDLEVVSRRTIKYCQDQPYNSLLNGCCVIDLYVKGAQLCHHETGTIITNP